jgi:endonuclease YncB( thermonuclease family)
MPKATWLGGVVLLSLAWASPASAVEWTGRVTAVYDGDTLIVTKGKRRVMVRLHGVDAPEWEQRYGPTAGNWVAQQVLYEYVRVVAVERDRYDRYVAMITMPNGKSLNLELLERGYAWVYRSFVSWDEYYEWIPIERRARNANRGLFRDDDPTPPWVWRRYN